ncbi:MAG: GTPase [Lachnospiraceae bacterium]|nr:GTPase [Lachnospiraceae bacterium]
MFKSTIPVYMINGFLESGKTEFIKYTLEQPYFRIRGTTLLIVCEEGESEYDATMLKKTGTVMELIEDEEDFTLDALEYLTGRHKPDRIIIEFNGMWNPKNIVLPKNWKLEQQITTINAASFPMYYTNMKSLVSEHVRNSEMIIFNRCDGVDDLASYKRNIKAVNAKAEIIFEDKDGEINVSLDEELPFDLNADIIQLDNTGYAIWYIDIMDNMERYEGKTIEFIATVGKPSQFPEGYFVPGRMAMTCCADDMAFIGFACKYKDAAGLTEGDWVKVRAVIHNEMFVGYRGVGPVLTALNVSICKEPKVPVIDFSNL